MWNKETTYLKIGTGHLEILTRCGQGTFGEVPLIRHLSLSIWIGLSKNGVIEKRIAIDKKSLMNPIKSYENGIFTLILCLL